jgi:hypothetical protein
MLLQANSFTTSFDHQHRFEAISAGCMATTGLLSAHHLLHTSEHQRLQSRPWASSVHDHVLHAAPHCQRQQHRAALLVHSSTCFEAAAAHQQQLPAQPCSNHLACGGLNGGYQLHQPQQHRGSNSCEAVSGGNWSIAAGPSLGWNTASTFFNKYRLGEVMGSGTFGEVRTAVHLQTGKPRYAVKVLSKHRIEVDAIRREVHTWQQAQNSKYVAKLEGLFEVGTETQHSGGVSPASPEGRGKLDA